MVRRTLSLSLAVVACGSTPEAGTDAVDAADALVDLDAMPAPDGSSADVADLSNDVAGDAALDVPSLADAAADADATLDATLDTEPDGASDAEPDIVPDSSGFECRPGSASTDFGVALRIDLERCEFSLAELSLGVVLDYTVQIESSEAEVWSEPLDAGQCGRPDESGLVVQERVEGNDQSWCVCDEGRCMGPEPEFIRLPPGTYDGAIDWDGRNWFGPSDFGNPPGEPFPPGDYLFVVRAAGQYRLADGSTPSWDISATAPIRVTE